MAEESVSLSINGRSVEAEKGRLLIDVAEEMNIFVPRFCYHPGMKSVAVCRMCLVKVEGQRKLLPACATPVADEMKVETVAPEAVEAQKDMLEFLLINHPLDCPICDRAGECPLQDQTYRHGPGTSRYIEPKRTYEKALEISDLVVLDRERCVLCWRCVRFCDEVSGDQFIQLVDRGAGTQILTFSDEPFDSYFSGNTIQICPVGALLSKPYRFVSRPWDLETAPSVCGYCSVGCPLTNEARQEELVRCQALPNEKVNDFWICDKGRFGYHYVSSGERLKTPLVRRDDRFETTSWSDAIAVAAEKLRGAKVGVVAGGHLSTEDAFAISKLARDVLETPHLDSRVQDEGAPYDALLDVTGLAGSTVEIDDLDDADVIVWVGPDPKEALPVLYLRLRKAALETGSSLVVVSPRALSLDSFADHVERCAPGAEPDALARLELDSDDVVVCWGPSSPGRDESPVVDAVGKLALRHGGKILVCPPHAGSQGLLDMGVHPKLAAGHRRPAEAGMGTREILEAAAAGELDALLLFGADVLTDFPDGDLARRALEGVGFTVVMELFDTETVAHADVVLPSVAYAEREGTFTNLERRLQKFEQLLAPPGSAREPWDVCVALAAALGAEWGWRDFSDVWAAIRKEVPTHAGLDPKKLRQEARPPEPIDQSGYVGDSLQSPLAMGGPGGQYPKGFRAGAPFQTGQNWPLSWELRGFEAKQRPGIVPPRPESPPAPDADTEGARHAEDVTPDHGTGTFALISGRMIYDGGAMVSKSRALRELQKKPRIEMNDEDVKELGLADGDEVRISSNGFETTLPLAISDIARGAVFVAFDQEGLHANALMHGRNPRVEVAST